MSTDELATDESSYESDEESSSSDDSDRFEYSSSSSDNDESSDSYSAEEIKIPEDYEPEEGVESDDDRSECCHWSTQQTEHSRIRKRRGIPEIGGPYQRYPHQTSSSDLAEVVLDETFIDRAIRCTNNHGQRDAKFLDSMNKTFGENKNPRNDKRINFFKGSFALKIYAGLMGIKVCKEPAPKRSTESLSCAESYHMQTLQPCKEVF